MNFALSEQRLYFKFQVSGLVCQRLLILMIFHQSYLYVAVYKTVSHDGILGLLWKNHATVSCMINHDARLSAKNHDRPRFSVKLEMIF